MNRIDDVAMFFQSRQTWARRLSGLLGAAQLLGEHEKLRTYTKEPMRYPI